MAQKDLIPVTQRTKEEAQELGRMGGKASGKVRKQKKELKERIMLAFEIYTKKLKEKATTADDKQIIDEMGADVFQIMSIAYDIKTKKETRLKALDMLWDRTVGKPQQAIDHTTEGKKIQIATVIDLGGVKDESNTETE